ncbi:hypothetical protein C7S17_4055 [Burkholderia thailandensis]|nr:hypothetical protein [Burkholderia thailandensis]
MPDPREAIAADDGGGQPPPEAGGERHRDAADHAERADEMQPSRHEVAVLVQIERIELGEAREMLGMRGMCHDSLLERRPWPRGASRHPLCGGAPPAATGRRALSFCGAFR